MSKNKKMIRNFIFVVGNLTVCYLIFSSVVKANLISIILWAVVCCVLCNVIFILLFFKTWEFKDMVGRIKFIVNKNEG